MDGLVRSRWNAAVRYPAHAWPVDALLLHCDRLPVLELAPAEAASHARFQQALVSDERAEEIANARLRYSHLQDLHPETFASSRNDELLDRCARRAAAKKRARREEMRRNAQFSQSTSSLPGSTRSAIHFPALRPSGLHCRSAQAYATAPSPKPQKYSDLLFLCYEKDRATQGRTVALRQYGL